MNKPVLCVCIVFLLLVSLVSCDRHGENTVEISLRDVEQIETPKPAESDEKLRIAIAAVISPKESFILYKELLDYISEEIGMPIQLVQRETYAEVNNMVRDNELDLAFVCSGAYVDGHDRFGMELLVAPIAYGKTVYFSYWIVPSNSTVSSIQDLRGKKFAFSDPMSNTGKLSPTYTLAMMHEDIDSFFKEYIYTYSHDRSIEMVAHNLVDGAAVDGLIYDYVNIKKPEITEKTKVIYRSEPYGIPPVVVPKQLPKEIKEKLRHLFLTIHETDKGRKILNKLLIDRFTLIDDSAYDSIRKMQHWEQKK